MTQSQFQNEISVDILDYLGKHSDGILVLISLGYQKEYYEATFFYTKEMLALTPDESLEKKLGSTIEEWSGYDKLMFDIIKKVVPYEEMINITDDFDPEKWGLFLDKN
jgi:hypothetical protein